MLILDGNQDRIFYVWKRGSGYLYSAKTKLRILIVNRNEDQDMYTQWKPREGLY